MNCNVSHLRYRIYLLNVLFNIWWDLSVGSTNLDFVLRDKRIHLTSWWKVIHYITLFVEWIFCRQKVDCYPVLLWSLSLPFYIRKESLATTVFRITGLWRLIDEICTKNDKRSSQNITRLSFYDGCVNLVRTPNYCKKRVGG